jgi:hypothetical protein
MDEKNNETHEKEKFVIDDDIQHLASTSSIEKAYQIESIEHTVESKYNDEEDIDIQVVNELATVEDDRTLPCYTIRVFVTGIVSLFINFFSPFFTNCFF